METTLVIMAAGIGSRFGTGIKQLTKMNDAGEIIIDYSIFDAKEAGFDRVAFVIRHDIEDEFREVIGNRIEKEIPVDYVFQELSDLPEGFSVPEGRTKPWGTGQAILACKGTVKNPFVIINADDYYGKTAFRLLHDFLTEEHEKTDQMRMAMAGFVLKNTVSENGTVTRGVCIVGQDNMLNGVIESRDIAIRDGKATTSTAESKDIINPESIVSMNMWACDPDFLDILEERFIGFLSDPAKDPLKGEFLVPVLIDRLIKENQASVKVLPTSDKWIGITYREDTDAARAEFKRMTAEGIYPAKLWN
ncbi:MAG: nucleotidyltransferase [Lachnospiraceae bacterium]|nr:nucleotidyltransferase [Lachnospiraceae bacterium]